MPQPLRRLIVLLLAALAAAASPAAGQGTALVLGGGGSRGIAHAGVLLGLERRGWEPELVVGTSMGAVVGALYAAGYTPEEIVRLFRAEDWGTTFAFEPVAFGADGLWQPALRWALSDGAALPQGLVPDRGINRALVRYLFDAGVRARNDFDRLPRRFRAVVADLGTGKAEPLAAGDLPRAVRASMAVPGVFAPVHWDARLLIDGGIDDNLPVDVARAAGAAPVIASEVVRPPDTLDASTPIRIATRAVRLLLRNAGEAGTPDYAVRPDLPPGFFAFVFPRDPGFLVDAGLAAALRTLPTAPAGAGGPPRPRGAAPKTLTGLRVVTPLPGLDPLVHAAFEGAAPGPYDAAAILTGVDRLYATGLFDAVWPQVVGGELVVRAEPRPRGSVAAAAGFDEDRGARGWLALDAWDVVGAPAEASLLVAADGLRREGALRLGVHAPWARPTWTLGGLGRATVIREIQDTTGDDDADVRRAGGWVGAELRTLAPRWVLEAQFRGESVWATDGPDGGAWGPVLSARSARAGFEPVGVPTALVLEARAGGVDYRAGRLRAALVGGAGRLRLAAVVRAEAVDGTAPLDALPALGDDRWMPGMRWGDDRARRLLAAGGDAAYPLLPFGGWLRLRLRAGLARGAVAPLVAPGDAVGGAALEAVWATPVGPLEAGFGADTRGDGRFMLSVGRGF